MCFSGKQLVQYTSQPVILPDPITTADIGGNDLPILLELEDDTYFEPAEDPTISLLNFSTSPVPQDPKL